MASPADHATRNDQPVAAGGYVTSAAQMASVQRRFYRFFHFVRLDGARSARMVIELLGRSSKPWVLVIDRTI